MKHEIAIVTDSAASLPQELVEKYGVTVVPIQIQFEDDAYRDGIDITREEFYRKLDGHVMPSTSQPAPSDFINVYERLLARFKTIISIHITSEGSGTCQVANIAKARFPGADIEVFDSKSASMGIGFLVVEAAEAVLSGKTKEEILRLLTELRPRIVSYAVIDSIRHLLKSGRFRFASQSGPWTGCCPSISPAQANSSSESCDITISRYTLQVLIRSLCVPVPATSPLSKTMILSASMTVLTLCATIITVDSEVSLFSAARSRASVLKSSAEKLSSKM
jgi:hypothetical protein